MRQMIAELTLLFYINFLPYVSLFPYAKEVKGMSPKPVIA